MRPPPPLPAAHCLPPATFRFVQLEQPFGRNDSDSPASDIDLDADVHRERNQYFATRSLDDQAAPAGAALHPDDRAHNAAFLRLHRTANELMLVVAARLQRP